MISFPKYIMNDINIAKNILLREGAKEVYIFGFLYEGNFTEHSDIDLATIGLKEDKYYKNYGELLGKLDHEFDLIGLDYENDFSKMIKESGKFEKVG